MKNGKRMEIYRVSINIERIVQSSIKQKELIVETSLIFNLQGYLEQFILQIQEVKHSMYRCKISSLYVAEHLSCYSSNNLRVSSF